MRIPTNDELSRPSNTYIYPTARFPMWALCTRHSGYQVLYAVETGCRECDWMPDWQRREKAGREAIRFVRCCKAGHLDDVDWTVAVHKSSNCNSDQFRWDGAGRSLRQSWLTCRKCKTRTNFGDIYVRTQRCSGRRPEVIGVAQDCNEDAKIIQRGASNLHVSVHETALTIGEMPLWLHQALCDTAVKARLEMLYEDDDLDEETFRKKIEKSDKILLTPSMRQRLHDSSWEQIQAAIADVLGLNRDQPKDLREEEFEFLQRGADLGVPAVPPMVPGTPPLIEVHKSDVHIVDPEFSNLGLRVTPVSRLRVVIAQTGYQRLGGRLTPVSFEHGVSTWYPGLELFGEGIFLDLPGNPLQLSGERVDAWRAVSDERCPTDPVFVWWHTLSHRVLRALSIDSGYSSAAIRERVYIRTVNGSTEGGLLLYTVQPGGDGTLGGLIEMAKRFSEVLANAVEDLDACSNDPLCEESPLHNTIGAVCYSCLLASETSCEWQNRGLDRIILRDRRP